MLRPLARSLLCLGVCLGAACSAPAAPPATPAPAPVASSLHRAFVIHYEGARVGYAVEDEQVTGGRRTFTRRELVLFRRDQELASFEIALVIRGAAAGDADELEVIVRHCTAASPTALPAPSLSAPLDAPCPSGAQRGPLTAAGSAKRNEDEWRVSSTLAGAPAQLPFAAQPGEWLDVQPKGDVKNLPLFFATRGFVMGLGERRWLDDKTWLGSVALAGKIISSTTFLGEDLRPRLVIEENGATSTRVADAAIDLRAPGLLDLVDLVSLTSLEVRGALPAVGAARRIDFTLAADAKLTQPLPTDAPGQLVTGAPPSLRLELVPQPARPDDAAAVAQIAKLARDVPPSHRDGDCTAYALRYAAAAARHNIPTRLATGFILNEISSPSAISGLLVRHRWAVSWTGARWISVDPSTIAGEVAPAGPHLFALSVHEASPEALASAEPLFAAWRGATARWGK